MPLSERDKKTVISMIRQKVDGDQLPIPGKYLNIILLAINRVNLDMEELETLIATCGVVAQKNSQDVIISWNKFEPTVPEERQHPNNDVLAQPNPVQYVKNSQAKKATFSTKWDSDNEPINSE